MTTTAVPNGQIAEASAEDLSAAELEGQYLVVLTPEMWAKAQKIAEDRGIGVGQAISEAIELETTLIETGGNTPDVYVKRPDGSLVLLEAK